ADADGTAATRAVLGRRLFRRLPLRRLTKIAVQAGGRNGRTKRCSAACELAAADAKPGRINGSVRSTKRKQGSSSTTRTMPNGTYGGQGTVVGSATWPTTLLSVALAQR